MKKVILAGNAITAEIVLGYLAYDDRYDVCGLVVDDAFVGKGTVKDIPAFAFSNFENEFDTSEFRIIMAMGYDNLNQNRESMFLRLKDKGFECETYIHEHAQVYSRYPIGEGCVVLPGTVVEPEVELGSNTMVWCNATLAHHSRIECNCWIASGAVISGKARVNRNSFVGVNATVVNEVTVGEYNIIGGSALISKDTKNSAVYLARSGEELRFTAQEYDQYFGV